MPNDNEGLMQKNEPKRSRPALYEDITKSVSNSFFHMAVGFSREAMAKKIVEDLMKADLLDDPAQTFLKKSADDTIVAAAALEKMVEELVGGSLRRLIEHVSATGMSRFIDQANLVAEQVGKLRRARLALQADRGWTPGQAEEQRPISSQWATPSAKPFNELPSSEQDRVMAQQDRVMAQQDRVMNQQEAAAASDRRRVGSGCRRKEWAASDSDRRRMSEGCRRRGLTPPHWVGPDRRISLTRAWPDRRVR